MLCSADFFIRILEKCIIQRSPTNFTREGVNLEKRRKNITFSVFDQGDIIVEIKF